MRHRHGIWHGAILFLLIFTSYPLIGKSEESVDLDHSFANARAALLPGCDSDHPHVPDSLWQQLEPYFIPDNHPIKEKLDRLFSRKRVTLSPETFEKAGFGKAKMRKPTNIVVGKHYRFNGYLFKVFLDTQPDVCEWDNWVKRIEGARSIKKWINKHHIYDFTVPKKWIYPLPAYPSPPEGDPRYRRKNFILIVEDMRILRQKENLAAYRDKITYEQLEHLYKILTEVGLIDSVYPDNAPFTKSGKTAFIDTEHHHLGPVHYDKLTRHLSPQMQPYWESLHEKG